MSPNELVWGLKKTLFGWMNLLIKQPADLADSVELEHLEQTLQKLPQILFASEVLRDLTSLEHVEQSDLEVTGDQTVPDHRAHALRRLLLDSENAQIIYPRSYISIFKWEDLSYW